MVLLLLLLFVYSFENTCDFTIIDRRWRSLTVKAHVSFSLLQPICKQGQVCLTCRSSAEGVCVRRAIGTKWYASQGNLARSNGPNSPEGVPQTHTSTNSHTFALVLSEEQALWRFGPSNSKKLAYMMIMVYSKV